MSGGILSDAEREVINHLFSDEEAAAEDHSFLLSQLRSVLEQVDDNGLRQQSVQIIEDVLGRAVARRHLLDDEAAS
ncbi:MAG: hypothetical protein ACPGU3_07080 [Litorivicinus sp.]